MLTSFISYQLKLKLKNCRNFWPGYIFPVFLLVPSICSTGGFLFLVNCGNSVSVFRRALPCCLAASRVLGRRAGHAVLASGDVLRTGDLDGVGWATRGCRVASALAGERCAVPCSPIECGSLYLFVIACSNSFVSHHLPPQVANPTFHSSAMPRDAHPTSPWTSV